MGTIQSQHHIVFCIIATGRPESFFCAPVLKIAQRGALPKVRISGHHFSRLLHAASMHSHRERPTYYVGKGESGSKGPKQQCYSGLHSAFNLGYWHWVLGVMLGYAD